MITIAIHATKGGFELIYGEQRLFADPNADTTSWQAIGQTAYSLKLFKNSCIFSKYKIIRDVIGGKRQGCIVFSAVISDNQKLFGADVKSLIDRISDEYCLSFLDGNNLGNVREDWSFINNIVKEYKSKLHSELYVNGIQSGNQEPAIIYYNDNNELQEYFDKPYQDEYCDFAQIYFIHNQLKSKEENPMNSLRNSGKELKEIDLTNNPYFISNYNRNKNVRIKAFFNNEWHERTDKLGENLIRAKWPLKIIYSKNERCYETINEDGKIADRSSKIHNYLSIDDNSNLVAIKWDAFNPNPIRKTVTFIIKDRKGIVKENFEVICKNNNYTPAKTTSTDKIDFSGEELIQSWEATAKKDSFSGIKSFTPIDDISVEIRVERRKKIIINVEDENGKKLSDFEVWTKLTKGFQRRNTIEFIDEQIDDVYNVTICKKGYKDYNLPNLEPAKQDEIDITLKKEQKHINQHPHKQTHKEKNSITSKVKTLFSKPAIIAGTIVSVLVLCVGIWALCYFFGNEKHHNVPLLTKMEITNYVEGDSLMLDKLKDYKSRWESQEQNYITKQRGGFFEGIFGGRVIADSTEWKSSWNPAHASIERAIEKRKLVNEKNFEKLKKLRYSEIQQKFKNAIEKIDSSKNAEIGKQLDVISSFSLTQIADSIESILTSREPKTNKNEQELPKENPVKVEQPKVNTTQEAQPAPNDKTKEIINYIRSSELKKETLELYLKDADKNKTLKASINLCLKLWSLDGTPKNSYSSYQKELNNDSNLKNSDLKKFIDAMCSKDKPKYIRELPATDQRKSLSQLTSKLQ